MPLVEATLLCGGATMLRHHYNSVIMSAMASQITSRIIVHPTVYSVADQRKHQSSASLAFVRGIRRWPVMPQSHHIPGPRTGCSRTVYGVFWTTIVRPLTGPAGAPCEAVRILTPSTGPVEFNACIIRLRAPYGFRYRKQSVRVSYNTLSGPARARRI